MIRLFVTVEDIEAVLAAGYTVIRVYTDTSSTGDFTTLDGTITLVADTDSYEYTDTDGTSSTWYKTAYYDASVGEGTKSAARKGDTRAAYATVEELRADIDMTNTDFDLTLARVLDAAKRAIDRFCNRPDGFMTNATASARYYVGSGDTIQWIDECAAISSVAVKVGSGDDEDSYTDWTLGTVGTTTSADVFPATGDPEVPDYVSTPYTFLVIGANGARSVFTSGSFTTRSGFKSAGNRTRGLPTVKVTAYWGFATSVPADIKEACIMQSARWFKRLQSAMADTAASSDFGQLLYRQSLDPDIKLILESGRYVRPPVGRRR
jgi:hypothetical protein